MLLSGPYQGNAWWTFGSMFCLALLIIFLLGVRNSRKAGLPIETGKVATISLFFLGLIAVAVHQVVTHPW